jgi:hypothetical protein
MNSYPDSFALVLVKDTENGRGWFSLIPPGNSPSTEDKIIDCMSEVNKAETQSLFNDNADIPTVLDIKNCGLRSTIILNQQGFPISVQYSDENIHTGWIKILVIE